MKKLVLAASVAALVATPAVAQNWNWRTIAFKTVSGGVDNDRINVRGNTRFRELRLCVFNAPLRMRDFDVRFENNQRQDVRVRDTIRAGTCTRNIDLTATAAISKRSGFATLQSIAAARDRSCASRRARLTYRARAANRW